MCSIVGSYSKEKFKELVELNQSRGSFSYSFMVIDPKTLEIVSLTQKFGPFDSTVVDTAPDDMYYLGHTQAPTGGLIEDPNRIHPARIDDYFMFHNGIIKQKDVARLQAEHNTTEAWDSKLMLMEIKKKGLKETLDTIDGSFACVFKDEKCLKIFRSAAGTLFIDDKVNISSTAFKGAERIEKDDIFGLELEHKAIYLMETFTSKSNPYFY